jgi:hypothetical protein
MPGISWDFIVFTHFPIPAISICRHSDTLVVQTLDLSGFGRSGHRTPTDSSTVVPRCVTVRSPTPSPSNAGEPTTLWSSPYHRGCSPYPPPELPRRRSTECARPGRPTSHPQRNLFTGMANMDIGRVSFPVAKPLRSVTSVAGRTAIAGSRGPESSRKDEQSCEVDRRDGPGNPLLRRTRSGSTLPILKTGLPPWLTGVVV